MKILLDQVMYEKNVSAGQLAVKTGIPKSSINDIMNGRSIPRLDRLEQLAKGLGVRMTDLFESPYK